MAKKEEKTAQIELTEKEINLIGELCLEELYNIGKLQYQRFVDRVEVQKRINEVKDLMNKVQLDK